MKLTAETRTHIDSLSYEDLLSKWRFAPVGDPWMEGETGTYWAERMKIKRNEESNPSGVSKNIGWEK